MRSYFVMSEYNSLALPIYGCDPNSDDAIYVVDEDGKSIRKLSTKGQNKFIIPKFSVCKVLDKSLIKYPFSKQAEKALRDVRKKLESHIDDIISSMKDVSGLNQAPIAHIFCNFDVRNYVDHVIVTKTIGLATSKQFDYIVEEI